MIPICLSFQVHIPYALSNYSFFQIGENPYYENKEANFSNVMELARECYLPANKILLALIKKHKGKFKVNFSISGTSLDLLEEHAPEVIESFQALAQTGCVDFITESYSHSLAFLQSQEEYKEQVAKHSRKIKKLFNVIPKVLRATELLYTNDLAVWAESNGYKALLTEGIFDRYQNKVYAAKGCSKIKVFMRNKGLSEDISLRFSDKNWKEYPLMADSYASWVNACANDENCEIVNIFMPYETIGRKHTKESGIFQFLESMPSEILKAKKFEFAMAKEIASKKVTKENETLDVSNITTWTDMPLFAESTTLWMNNDLQNDALTACYALEETIKEANNKNLIQMWRILQSAEYFSAMSIDFHPVNSSACYNYADAFAGQITDPYDMYINYMNILADLNLRAKAVIARKKPKIQKVNIETKTKTVTRSEQAA